MLLAVLLEGVALELLHLSLELLALLDQSAVFEALVSLLLVHLLKLVLQLLNSGFVVGDLPSHASLVRVEAVHRRGADLNVPLQIGAPALVEVELLRQVVGLVLVLPELPLQPSDGVLLLLVLPLHDLDFLEVGLVVALEGVLELLLLLELRSELTVFGLHLLEALLSLLDHGSQFTILVLSHHLAHLELVSFSIFFDTLLEVVVVLLQVSHLVLEPIHVVLDGLQVKLDTHGAGDLPQSLLELTVLV